MGWRDRRASVRRFQRVALALATAALAGGCFQPLYGTSYGTDRPGVRDALGGVDVAQIDAPAASDESRLAVQIRNELLFGFTGGGDSGPRTHRLVVNISPSRAVIGVNPSSGLAAERKGMPGGSKDSGPRSVGTDSRHDAAPTAVVPWKIWSCWSPPRISKTETAYRVFAPATAITVWR